jgi:hypothetical protein
MKHIKLILLAIAIVTVAGCGGGSTSPSTTSNSYQGAGSDWSLKSNNDGTCVLTENTSSLTVNATCKKLPSGFTEIEVTSAAGGNSTIVAPSAGDKTYAYEISGYMMPFIAPEGSKKKVVPAVISGTCSTTLSHNFIVSFAQTTSAANSDFSGWGAYGKYSSSDGKSLTTTIYKSDGTVLADNISIPIDIAGNCSAGKSTIADSIKNETSHFYLTQNGGAIFYQDRTISTDPDTTGSFENDFMLPVDGSISNTSSLDGNYIGFVITGNGRVSYTNTPVSVTATGGTFTVSSLSDDTSTTINTNHSSFSLTSATTPGLYKTSLTHTNTGNIGCAATLNAGGKKVVICGGIDPADTTNKSLYSIILAGK